jgi:hypothetical protein
MNPTEQKPYRIVLSSKGQAAGLVIALAIAGDATGRIPPLYAFGGIVLVVLAYIVATAIEDKRPRTAVTANVGDQVTASIPPPAFGDVEEDS